MITHNPPVIQSAIHFQIQAPPGIATGERRALQEEVKLNPAMLARAFAAQLAATALIADDCLLLPLAWQANEHRNMNRTVIHGRRTAKGFAVKIATAELENGETIGLLTSPAYERRDAQDATAKALSHSMMPLWPVARATAPMRADRTRPMGQCAGLPLYRGRGASVLDFV